MLCFIGKKQQQHPRIAFSAIHLGFNHSQPSFSCKNPTLCFHIGEKHYPCSIVTELSRLHHTKPSIGQPYVFILMKNQHPAWRHSREFQEEIFLIFVPLFVQTCNYLHSILCDTLITLIDSLFDQQESKGVLREAILYAVHSWKACVQVRIKSKARLLNSIVELRTHLESEWSIWTKSFIDWFVNQSK